MIFRKIIDICDTVTDAAALILCLIVLLIGLYSVYDSYMMIHSATDDSILKYKPGYDGPLEEEDKEILPRMVAWLSIDGTKIDYPVMQGQDNMEFLNKNPFGEYSLAGSIFLDCSNKTDFSDPYSLIYGHHMEEGAMFGPLDDYIRQEFLEDHSKGHLIVNDDRYDILFYASFHADATNKSVFSPSEQDGREVLIYAKQHALSILPEHAPKKKDRILALSTCRYPESIERTVVIGVLKEQKQAKL